MAIFVCSIVLKEGYQGKTGYSGPSSKVYKKDIV
jgi:hypothetical protein